MKIIGVACVKNESDIIEAFVRHNLSYVDELIILDHGSTDSTSAILRHLKEEGLQVTVEWDPSLGKFQGEKMTRLMQRAVQERKADWVLLLDADEFIRCDQERLELPPPTEGAPYLKVSWQTYCTERGDLASILNPVERIKYRLEREPFSDGNVEERRHYLKAVVPRTLAVQPGICVMQGNHHLLIAHTEPPHQLWTGFGLAHYSLRSVGQYASKISIDLLQQLYKSSPQANMDSFYVPHFEELRHDVDLFASHFPERIPSYLESLPDFHPARVKDPLPYRGGALRYTSHCSDYALLVSNLLNHAEILARSLAEHASAHTAVGQQIPLIAQLSCQQKGVPISPAMTLTAHLVQTQILLFPLVECASESILHLLWQSPGLLVEILRIRLRRPQDGTWEELSGPALRSRIWTFTGAAYIHHDHYFCFLKGDETADIALKVPALRRDETFSELEIELRLETNPGRLGSRLLQSSNLDQMIRHGPRVDEIAQKLARRSTLLGAIGYQYYRLRRWLKTLLSPWRG
jgi:glycosyltransferase involved in cell wall biosynthesis